MEESIISIKNIGKRYNINHHKGGYLTLRDILATILKNPFKFLTKKVKQIAGIDTKEEFWALKNINLQIKKGEIIGFIGRNGAGKSTLLKILTGITPPTDGEISIYGRVASLLEVGTGFHPELTGRENIFLNGAILGMTRKEISRKFDEIVGFAGIEKFLDTPVKYYSSGMYVRLAFSVAAHMEPDILLVDEVLAVGDAEFQKKCLGKMEEVAETSGRTILFVSHDLSAIKKLCKKTVLIKDGQIAMFDNTDKVIEHYLAENEVITKVPLEKRKDRSGTRRVLFSDCKLSEYNKENRTLSFTIEYKNFANKRFDDVKVSADIRDYRGMNLTNVTNSILHQKISLDPELGVINLNIYDVNLSTGTYHLGLFLASDSNNAEIFDSIEEACVFELNNDAFYSTLALPPVPVRLLFDFEFKQ